MAAPARWAVRFYIGYVFLLLFLAFGLMLVGWQ